MNTPVHPLPTRAAAAGAALRRRVLQVAAMAAVTASLVSTASPASADAAGSFRLSTLQNPLSDRTEVVRWDPCSVVDYRINAALGGRQAKADVQAAVARLSAASGLRFRYLGSTTAVPAPGRPAPAGTDLVVAWAKPTSTSHLRPGAVGHGGWHATTSATGRFRITSAYVVVRAGAPLAIGFGPGVTRGRVLLHELGHAVGLDHVGDPVMVMHDAVTPRSPSAVFRAGDLAGLRRVGSPAGCVG